jgi:hypothetical protein
MIDPFDNVDFGPMYDNLPACLEFLRTLPDKSATDEPVQFHMYWKTARPFGRKQILPIKSFLATQPYRLFQLNLWSNTDLTTNELLKPWLSHINFRIYDPLKEGRGTLLEGTAALLQDDAMVYIGGDLFRALILHNYGGVYVDMDSVFLRDFSPVLGKEFMYKWSFQKDMISSAVMYLHERGELAQELLRGIATLPPGGTNWGCQNNMRAYAIKPFRIFPCAFFNPEWQVRLTPEERADTAVLEPFKLNKYTNEMYPNTFVWHWHNRWEEPIEPGCKFEKLEQLIEQKLCT